MQRIEIKNEVLIQIVRLKRQLTIEMDSNT
jgi:hypothetical protein